MNGRAMKLRVVRGANGTKHWSRRAGDVKRRRGVILLVVLALLTLFALMTMTFILVASQARRTAQASTGAEQHGDAPQDLLDMAAKQVLRGTDNPLSVLRPHSLLEDIYGNGAVVGTVGAFELTNVLYSPAGGSFISLVVDVRGTDGEAGVADFDDDGDGGAPDEVQGELGFGDDLSAQNEFYAGRVITMLDGAAKGQSARIVGYRVGELVDTLNPTYMRAELRLLPFGSMRFNAAGTGWEESGAPQAGDRFVINGAPFSGTGFGYKQESFEAPVGAIDPIAQIETRLLDASIRGPKLGPPLAVNSDPDHWEFALLPNPVYFEGNDSLLRPYVDPAGPGGANEDYDAPDFQNMLLALLATTSNTADEHYPVGVVIPSLHRSELINYWYERLYDDLTFMPTLTGTERWEAILRPDLFTGMQTDDEKERIVRLKRKISLRPLREDHPNFTGSNPAVIDDQEIYTVVPDGFYDVDFDGDGTKDRLLAINGPWDVDNDGDGHPDSIWVDLGMPAQTSADGRQYKPLFAILCVDLDGRVNLNAHGSLAQFDHSVIPPTLLNGLRSVAGPYAGGTAGVDTVLAMGQGYGPAEINPGFLLGNTDYLRVLTGDNTVTPVIDGRYGERSRDFTALAGIPRLPGPGLTFFGTYTAGREPNWNARVKFFDYPGNSYVGVSITGDDNPEYHDFLTNAVTYRASAFGTAPDIDGNGVVGVDLRGVPYWPNDSAVGMADANERIRNPYKVDLSLESQREFQDGTDITSVDRPFTLPELERALRYSDLDSTALPSRLLALASTSLAATTDAARRNRARVTTESWDLPTPNLTSIPPEIAADLLRIVSAPQNAGSGITINDVLLARLVENTTITLPALLDRDLAPPGWVDSIPALSEPTAVASDPFNLFATAQDALLAPELRAGLRFDINRPFGNGRDDSTSGTAGYNVVDEPRESGATAETIWPNVFSNSSGTLLANINVDIDNDGVAHAIDDGTLARQEYAKHLYCLAWLLLEGEYVNRVAANHFGDDVADARQEVARQIAQWATNVVDFRDSDAVMTPFEYDIVVFDGTWDVDGDLTTTTEPNRGVVWGCEKPELLITETLAFHDRRVEWNDTDDKFEQKRSPEGSLFVELYNPSSPMDTPPGELSATAGTQHGIDLQKTTPTGDPVWRMIVARRIDFDTVEFSDPDDPDRSVDYETDEVERSVYFTNSAPAVGADGQQYYQGGASPSVPAILPGRYAVIGPPSGHSAVADHTTYVGERPDGVLASARRIVLTPNANADIAQVTVDNNDSAASPTYPAPFEATYPLSTDEDDPTKNEIQPPVAVVISQPRRLSVSEPVAGYPAEVEIAPGEFGYNPPAEPIDADRASGDGQWQPVANTGTEVAFRAIHLQRLANPLLDWHATTNPYITVDTMPIDLTAFNGSDTNGMPELLDSGGTVMFESRQRGETSTEPLNIWRQEVLNEGEPTPSKPEVLSPGGDGTHRFDYVLKHSLGYLNMPYGDRWNMSVDPPGTPTPAPVSGTIFTADDYRGMPVTPFPWLAWNNRPYTSQYELLQVPADRSSRLLRAHTMGDAASNDPYEPSTVASLPIPPWYPDLPYQHLPNFFMGDYVDGGGVDHSGAYSFRLFEFLHVPSRFVGTETVLDPTNLTNNVNTFLETGWNHGFHPPFNRISRYREPGRVNINTIYDADVWKSVVNGYPQFGTDAFFAELFQSRRGFDSDGLADADPTVVDDDWPTRFGNPFRSFGGNHLVPLDDMRKEFGSTTEYRREIESTLLRSKVSDDEEPLFGRVDPSAHGNSDRNSYFRYHALQKLGNLVTTRSNVYAVWITVGFFEVEQGGVDAGHPDGYRLGRELGIETGEVRRHRAFYVFDRTVPVGFERGEDHNVERAVRLRRFIE